MKRIGAGATLALLLTMTACSSGKATEPKVTPSSPPQVVAPVAGSPAAGSPAAGSPAAGSPAAGSPAAGSPPAGTPGVASPAPAAGSGQAPAPTVSLRRAFALVRRTAEAQEAIGRLGSRLSMVNTSRTAEVYHVSLGENLPDRVRFELHFTVSRADGTVHYADRVTGQAKLATLVVSPPDPVTAQVQAMLGRGDIRPAVELLTKAAAERPAADTWNLLSYAHLLTGQWQEAADAGEKALQLDEFHAYALYNTGMAQLELRHYEAATRHLRDAAEVQPQRTEPRLGLARAYQETGRYALAADAAAAALKLSPGDAVAMKTREGVDGMVSHTAPADLSAAGRVQLVDAPYTIYLYPGKGEREKSPAVLYLKGPDGIVGLPVGEFTVADWTAFTRVDLPGGATGYFLSGESVGAYVARSLAWRLFVRSPDGRFRQVVFVGEEQLFDEAVGDFVRSQGPPSVQGEQLVATYGHDASDKSTVKVTWQLPTGEAQAIRVEATRENRDPNQ